MMGTTSSITMHSLEKIAQCAPVVSAKMWCFLFLSAGLPRSGKLAKNQVFRPQRRLVAPIRVKLRRNDGHLGPLGSAKFHVNRCRGLGMRPQNIKKFHFLVKSRPAGATLLTDFNFF